MDDGRKEILKGIIDVEHQARVSIVRAGGSQLVLDCTYEEVVDRLVSGVEEFLEFTTFGWVGSSLSEQTLHRWAVRADQILEVQEINDDQWFTYVTEISNRAQQVAQQKAGIVNPRMN